MEGEEPAHDTPEARAHDLRQAVEAASKALAPMLGGFFITAKTAPAAAFGLDTRHYLAHVALPLAAVKTPSERKGVSKVRIGSIARFRALFVSDLASSRVARQIHLQQICQSPSPQRFVKTQSGGRAVRTRRRFIAGSCARSLRRAS